MKFKFWKKEVIKKTPRDYASEMYQVISDLQENEQDAAFYSLLRILYPNKHLHTNPQRKGA